MASEVGVAYVSIVPSTRGFAAGLNRQVQPPIQKTGVATGRRFGSAFGLGFRGLGAGLLGAAGLGVLVKGAATTEAEFSKTMNVIAAATNTPKAGIQSLSDLALTFGAQTVFSANEAADAMLELAKGGLTVAQIRGGALSETLTLAAASGADLATSSTILSNAMNTFGLAAKDTPKITAALAGGANASTASIQSLGEAMQQVGPGAKTAGLTINDTVAALAAFDNAGIKGSDAGTSLKTMLARLVPQTDKAQGAMDALGLTFTDATGAFLPFPEIVDRLNKAFRGLSQHDRSVSLNRIFGSDASRAASVLADLGKNGIRPFIKATEDMDAAQRIAQARMSGTAGALEQLRGSFETAQLRIGQALAPAIQAGAGLLTRALNSLAVQIPALVKKIQDPFGTFQTEIRPRLVAFGGFLKNTLAPALAQFAQTVAPQVVKAVKSIVSSVRSVLSTFQTGDGSGGNFNRTLLAVKVTAAGVTAGLKLLAVNVRGLATAFRVLTFVPQMLASVAVQILTAFARPIINAFGFIVNAAAKAFGWVPGLGPKLKAAAAKFAVFKAQVNAALSGFGALGFQIGSDFAANLAAGIAGRGQVTKSAALGTANKLAAGLRSGGLIEGARADVRKGGGGGDLNVTVNNPTPERASDSVDKVLRRRRHAAGWAAG